MNKQELIDKYTAEISRLRPYCPNRHLISEQLKYDLYKEILEDLKQLDEPQKLIVPKFVADWFEEKEGGLENAIFYECVRVTEAYSKDYSEFQRWFVNYENNPIETLIRMKNGYEVEESKWVVNEGDLVIRKGEHEAKVYFVESVDDDGILLVNGIKDEFFTDLDDRSVDEESINYFYENFRLLAKKENLEAEKVEV